VAERGVAPDRVTVGIALIDTGPLGAAPQYNQGEPEQFYEAILQAWRKDGTLPVHGRDVSFVYRRYSVLDNNEQRAACKFLIEDRKAFALIGTVLWQVGADCSAKELKTPTLTSDAVHERTLASGDPYLFSLAMSEDRQLRNVAHWAHTKKLVKGKVGVYYFDESIEAELIRRTVVGELKKLGYEVVEATSNTNQSSQNDLLAVRRFQQENVETAFVLNSREGFTNAAAGQGYKPRYLDTDHNYGTTDSATTRYNAEQYEGTLAFTGRRGGEFQAGMPRTAEQQRCVEIYKAHTGEDLEDDTFKFQMAMHSCDSANAILTGLQRAGSNLTRDSFVAALETIKDQPLARSGNATFGPGKHHGADAYRTLQWQSACRCYKALEDFSPLLVP
jgi:ABC-type branched-subunit amino acid transport system substrate-binding protein